MSRAIQISTTVAVIACSLAEIIIIIDVATSTYDILVGRRGCACLIDTRAKRVVAHCGRRSTTTDCRDAVQVIVKIRPDTCLRDVAVVVVCAFCNEVAACCIPKDVAASDKI